MLKTDFCTLKSTAAASLPEYGLTVGLVAVISIGSVSAVGQEILSTMQTSSEEIRGIGSGAYNHVLNGDFSVTTNMDETFYGFNAYDIFGWTSLNGEIIQYTESGYMDLTSKKGLYSVDIYGSTASIDIEQVIDSLAKDRSYTLSLHVADRHAPMGDAQAHIYWGGVSDRHHLSCRRRHLGATLL